MFSEAKVTEIYCMADDFCKEFALQQEKYMVKESNHNHRNKPNRMNDAEIMVILILFHSGGFRCFKHYYNEYVCKHLTHLFPRVVSYNRFVELEKDILLPLTIFEFAVTKEYWFIKPLKAWPLVENVPWDGSSGSSCTW